MRSWERGSRWVRFTPSSFAPSPSLLLPPRLASLSRAFVFLLSLRPRKYLPVSLSSFSSYLFSLSIYIYIFLFLLLVLCPSFSPGSPLIRSVVVTGVASFLSPLLLERASLCPFAAQSRGQAPIFRLFASNHFHSPSSSSSSSCSIFSLCPTTFCFR